MGRRLTWEQIVEKANKKHNFKFSYEKQDFENGRTKIFIKCNTHGDFLQSIESHLTGRGCSQCAKNKPYTKDSLLDTLTKKYLGKYQYDLSSFENNESIISINCKLHGFFKMKVSNHLHGQECKYCSHMIYSNDDFIAKCKEIHNNYYDYSKTFYKNYKSKIIIICPKHGEFIQNARTHFRGSGCSDCKRSKGELFIQDFLHKKNIKYIRQMKFEDCSHKKKLSFDFFLPDYKICIEYDGEQHFRPVNYFGGLESFERQIIRDKIKNEFCNENQIKLIRFNYKQTLNKIEMLLNEIQI